MIVVDSSVWIDAFNAKETAQSLQLMALFGKRSIAIPDLALTEVLQGAREERHFQTILRLMNTVNVMPTTGPSVAVQAARNYRYLRAKGITVRKTIDTLIATRCILDGHELLHSDRDFDPFVEHLGLRVVSV
jgi:predicted nucleic acid-binding protein